MESIISFPERGKWGKSSYRGNCSGYVIKDIIEQFKCKEITDPMSGSYTTRDVCEEMGVKHHCYDLSMGFNALTDEIPYEACGSDTWFWHPPYSAVIGIPYAGSQWDDKPFINRYGYDPKEYDLGAMPWEKFIKALNYCMMKFYAAMDTGARMCVLMGDIKKKGKLYSMLCEIAKPGVLENIVIKAEHNCVSDKRTYGNTNFIPIKHEYLMILKKLSPYILDFKYTVEKKLDIRDSMSVTWRDVVSSVIKKLGNNATLEQIYREVEGHRKVQGNSHWKEKIRQTLYSYNMFAKSNQGMWSVA